VHDWTTDISFRYRCLSFSLSCSLCLFLALIRPCFQSNRLNWNNLTSFLRVFNRTRYSYQACFTSNSLLSWLMTNIPERHHCQHWFIEMKRLNETEVELQCNTLTLIDTLTMRFVRFLLEYRFGSQLTHQLNFYW